MRIVVAPDSFKGTATAAEAAEAIAAGWLSVRPSDELVLRPLADGGEGTLDAIAASTPGATRMPVTVTGPADEPVETHWVLMPDGTTAVVELAATSGITLLPALAPFTAHTLGLGEAIAAALDHGATRVIVAIGGSASTDGGSGMLAALGARMLDSDGRPLPLGAAGLEQLATVDLSGLRELPSGGVTVLSDVDNPLLGQLGAAAVFGPQKGLTSPDDIARADAALAHLAERLAAHFPGLDHAMPGAGAAGGAGFGLLAWGATLRPGAPVVADTVGLDAALIDADLIVTGEGRFDGQTAAGKVPHEVAQRADARGTPRALVAGAIDAPPTGFTHAVALAELAGGSAAAMAQPTRWLREAGAHLARQRPALD